jgi:outer membrane protein assembly factor BamD (BamD/ComL family)
VRPALAIMIECDHRLGLDEHARNLEQVYQLNFPGQPAGQRGSQHWWTFWR